MSTKRIIIQAMVLAFSFPLFFSCQKDDDTNSSNPIIEQKGIPLKEFEATKLSVKNLIAAFNGNSITDFIAEATKIQSIRSGTEKDSLVYLTTTAGYEICVDLYGICLREHNYDDNSIDTCGTYFQNYFEEIEKQYQDSISDGVEYAPFESDSIDFDYGDDEDVIVTRATLHHRKILNKKKIAVWSPWPEYKKDDENGVNAIANQCGISCTNITDYSPSSFSTFGDYDLVFIGAHGDPSGKIVIPFDCSSYYYNKYRYIDNGIEKIDVLSLNNDGIIYGFTNKNIEVCLLGGRFFDKYLSNLSNTIICTSICYAGRSNSQFLQSARNKGCPEFYGGDNPLNGTGPITFFSYYLPMFVNGASAKASFEKGEAYMTKGNYKYLRYGNTNVTYFIPCITGKREVNTGSAVLGVRFQYSADIPGSLDSETSNEYGIYLQNLDNNEEFYIPLSKSMVVYENTETILNSVNAYFANIKIDGLTPNTNYLYRTYVVVGNNKPTCSDTSEKFTTGTLLCPDNRHPHAIDLGLPSGTKWACCNVGASSPEQYGNYYAWGETSPKSVYGWDTYQYGSSWENVVNIGSDIAGTRYDAATANWGAPWRMPSLTQIEELRNYCSKVLTTTQNGVSGRKFVGPNGGAVFLPAAGYRHASVLSEAGFVGHYWSSTLCEEDPGYAYAGNAYELLFFPCSESRRHGRSVRPVR